MKVHISSRIVITDPTMEVINWAQDNLVLTNPMWQTLKRMGKEDTIRYKHVPAQLDFARWSAKAYEDGRQETKVSLPFGCMYGVWPFIKDAEITTDFTPDMPISIKDLPLVGIDLFDYQEEAILSLIAAKGGVLQASCGAGKTITGIELVHRIGKRVLWIAHTKDLVRQAREDFLKLFPTMDIGEISDGKVRIGRDGAVSTIQTLTMVDPEVYADQFDVIVVDECHRCCADVSHIRMYEKVLGKCKARYRYGLTATAFRSDSLGKTIYFNLGMCPSGEFRPTFTVGRDRTQSLTAEFVGVDYDGEFSWGTLNPDGTFNYAALVDILSEDPDRNAMIVKKVKELVSEGRRVSILGLRVEHCKNLTETLINEGIRAVCVVGSTSDRKRKELLRDSGEWDVIVSTTALFKEGLDIKSLDTVFLVAPIKDKSSVIQACGRCERPLEGKKQPLFLDICDTNYPYCVSAFKKRRNYILKRS